MLVAALFAAGAANPDSFRPPKSEVLSAQRLEEPSQAEQNEAYLRSLAELADAADLSASPVDLPVPPVEVAPPTTVPPPASAERAIVAPASFSARSPKAAKPRTLSSAAGPKEGGVWAVSVGIDDYPGTDGDLRAAAADAKDVDAALSAYGVPGSHRILLLDHNATAENIRSALVWLAAKTGADGTAVFFYSGHVRQVSGDPDKDGESVDEALVGADGDHVFDGDMANIFRSLDAKSAWIGIAACYAGGFDDALAPGRVLTAAAGETDVAYENSQLGHSYLVEYMVRRAMLQGKAPGSVQDAFAWARSQIAKDYPNRQPVMLDKARGPLVLGRGTTDPPPAEPKPAPEAQPQPQPAPAPGQSESPAPPSEPSPGAGSACAEVLGVTVCSVENSSNPKGGPPPGWRESPL